MVSINKPAAGLAILLAALALPAAAQQQHWYDARSEHQPACLTKLASMASPLWAATVQLVLLQADAVVAWRQCNAGVRGSRCAEVAQHRNPDEAVVSPIDTDGKVKA